MGTIEVTWIAQQRFLGVDSTGHSIVLSPPDDVGVKPSDTLLIALAACMALDVVEILRKQRTQLEQLAVGVTAEQASDPPWAFRHIHLQLRYVVGNLRPGQVERAVDLALNKYCSVRASLSADVEVTVAVEALPPAYVGLPVPSGA